MTPHDLEEDERAAERGDIAYLHDLTAAHNAERYPTSGTPGLCPAHALPLDTDGCPQCATEDEDHINRYDAMYVWRYQRTRP